MKKEQLDELKKIAQSYQDKYVYYYLALAVTAIGFTFTQTQDMENFHCFDIFLGLSIIFWGSSFWVGTRNRELHNTLIHAEHELKEIEYTLINFKNSPEAQGSANETIKKVLESKGKNNKFSNYWQRNFFFAGIISFVVWRVLEIAIS